MFLIQRAPTVPAVFDPIAKLKEFTTVPAPTPGHWTFQRWLSKRAETDRFISAREDSIPINNLSGKGI